MGGLVSAIFEGPDKGAIDKQLKAQKDAATAQLAAATNAEASSAQDLARSSRTRGGRKLLSFLGDEGAGTLG